MLSSMEEVWQPNPLVSATLFIFIQLWRTLCKKPMTSAHDKLHLSLCPPPHTAGGALLKESHPTPNQPPTSTLTGANAAAGDTASQEKRWEVAAGRHSRAQSWSRRRGVGLKWGGVGRISIPITSLRWRHVEVCQINNRMTYSEPLCGGTTALPTSPDLSGPRWR